MSLVYAEATLLGRGWAAANGDLFLEVAVGVLGDATTTSDLRSGLFNGAAIMAGDATVVPDAFAERPSAAVISGDGVFGIADSAQFLVAADLDGDSIVSPVPEVAVEALSDVAGDASTTSDADTLLGAVGAVQGDATVVVAADVDHSAASAISGDATTTARCLEDDEIASDAVGGAAVGGELEGTFLAAAALVGSAEIPHYSIVRQQTTKPPKPDETAPEVRRYVGFDPDRQLPEQDQGRTTLMTDPDRIVRQNEDARRQVSVVRKDTGVRSVVVKKKT